MPDPFPAIDWRKSPCTDFGAGLDAGRDTTHRSDRVCRPYDEKMRLDN